MIPSGKDSRCLICGATGVLVVRRGKDFFVRGGRSPDFEVWHCSRCLNAYSQPSMNLDELKPYYPEHYEAYVPKKSWQSWVQVRKYESDLRFIRRGCKKGVASMFEIGSGRGEFLYHAKKSGFGVEGVEWSKLGVDSAMAHYGIALRQGSDASVVFAKTYDVVAARHVLEHTESAGTFIQNVYRHGLSDGGVLMLKLPRFDSWERRAFGRFWIGLDLPRHRLHFSKDGIQQLLIQAGFKKIRFKSEAVGLDAVRSLRFYADHGKSGALRLAAKWVSKSPFIVQVILAQAAVTVLAPLGAGRMMILATK